MDKMEKMEKRLETLGYYAVGVEVIGLGGRKCPTIFMFGVERFGMGCYGMHAQMMLFIGTMPPRRVRRTNSPRRSGRAAVERLIATRVAEAIAEHERNRPNPSNARGAVNVLKVEQVFKICKCAEEDKVKFATCTFEGRALTWWNGNVHTLGLVNANSIPWNEFKIMMTTEYCPARMKHELWTLTLKGDDIEAYYNRFHELALMCSDLVTPEKKKIERYIRGPPERVKVNVTSSKPASLHDAINMARELVEQAVQAKATRISEGNKRKWKDYQRNTSNNNPNNNNCNRNNNNQHQHHRRQDVAKAYAVAHGHLRNKCPKRTNQQNEEARARAYVMGTENPLQNPNVVTSTFLLNDHYASILFNLGAERSFVSTLFTPFIDIAPAALDTSYEVELADEKIDLLPTRLCSFDVIVGMDWLSYHRAVIVCYEKIVRIPLSNDEILEIQGERPKKDLKSLSCIKADEKKLVDISIVCDFPEIFPDDFSGLPPVCEIEFRIDLIPGALPVVKSPYRLAPFEMLELS
ncbi:putative reverse transcriptase domain-containing protein, partial [Tanacetum coccineum]